MTIVWLPFQGRTMTTEDCRLIIEGGSMTIRGASKLRSTMPNPVSTTGYRRVTTTRLLVTIPLDGSEIHQHRDSLPGWWE
jgi:hypothetical protein